MTKEQARNAIAFLQRIQLAPAEIPAYSQVMNALVQITEPTPAATPTVSKGDKNK